MYTVTTARIDVTLSIDLNTVWNTGVCIREDPPVGKRVRGGINVEGVTG